MSRFTISNNYPSDWKCFSFDQLFDFEGGLSISREKLSDEGICYLHYGDIHTSSKNYIDVKKDYEKLPKYNEKLQNINQKYLLNDGDIVIADASEDHEGIGKAVVIFNEEKIPFISGLHTIVAKDKTDLIYRDFKRYFLSDWYIRKQMMFYATGISVFGLSKENVKKIQVILPSKLEQRKIADILSTWDKAIELKEKLIEQKKEQKKGLMQRLLMRQVRLPGHKGEWKQVFLGNICRIRTGKKDANAMVEHGKYKFFTCADEDFNIDSFSFDTEALIISGNGNIGKIKYYKGKFDAYQRTYVLDNFTEDIHFIKHYLSLFFSQRVQKETQKGAMPYIKLSTLSDYLIELPDLNEQKAISNLLNVFDYEINLLEKELDALKQQKKGLMQLLLTGKVRVKC